MVPRMVRNFQRLGGGLVSVTAISWRASSPGPWWSRSRRSSGSTKRPPTEAALGVSDQPGRPRRLVAIEPGIHGIGIAWLQEPARGDLMGSLAVGDLQERGAPLADIGTRVVVAQLKEFLPLLFGQGEGTTDHEGLLRLRACTVDRADHVDFTDFERQNSLEGTAQIPAKIYFGS